MKILILYTDAGHGHRKVAEAILEEIEARKSTKVSADIYDSLAFTNKSFRYFYPRLYYQVVKSTPWLWGFFFHLTNNHFVYSLIRPLRTFWNSLNSKKLEEFIQDQNYDYVLLTHFFPAEVSARLKANRKISAKILTVVTDTIPHHVWINHKTDQYWVMSEESRHTLLKLGINDSSIQVKGIPVSARFTKNQDKTECRNQLGVERDRFTILFSSGSFGLGPTQEILTSLESLKHPIQALVVCGTNKELFKTLSNQKHKFPVAILGFVDNMPQLMGASDIIIAKPGGATMCEALGSQLPMLITEGIPGQEDGNERLLLDSGAARKLTSVSEASIIIHDLVSSPDQLKQMKQKINSIAKKNAARDLVDFLFENRK
jgi:processive 1,2-diacylglycerol beta-glucosyltransferase